MSLNLVFSQSLLEMAEIHLPSSSAWVYEETSLNVRVISVE